MTDAEGNEYETTAFNFSSYYDDRHAEDPEEYGWDTLDDVTLVDCGLGTMDELSEMFDYLFMELEGSWVALVQRGRHLLPGEDRELLQHGRQRRDRL